MTVVTKMTLGVLACTVISFVVPPAKNFRDPDLARIIFFHLPCAILTSVMIILAGWHGLRCLRKQDPATDVRLAATTEIGAILGVLAMATGILFSQVQWGAWWQGDPRQTSFLMVLLLLSVALSLRAGIGDEQLKARVSAAYAIISLVPALFLIFVYPRLPHVIQASFHPSTTIQTGGFDATYRVALIATLVIISAMIVMIYRTRVAAGLSKLAREQRDERMDANSPDTTGSNVVRPVPVSPER